MARECLYRTVNQVENLFAVYTSKSGDYIDFWHITGKQTFLYTFSPSEKFHQKRKWSEDLCLELLEDLRKPKPSCQVQRFAVNDQLVFVSDPSFNSSIPRIPRKVDRSRNRAAIEEYFSQQPAPFILYGTHEKGGKEYAWKLTPDKPKRQGINPGDWVVVWTKQGFTTVRTSRIEPSEGKEQPKYRVKKKLYGTRRPRPMRAG